MKPYIIEVGECDGHRVVNDERRNKAVSRLEKRSGPKRGAKKELPSIMDRIRVRRAKGAKCVADYVLARRHEFLHILRTVPEMLLPEEWALIERELREIAQRKAERHVLQKNQGHAVSPAKGAHDPMTREIAEILSTDNRVEAAGRSPYSINSLLKAGLTRVEGRKVSEFRRPAVKLKEAAEILGVRRGTLDRWCREGVILPSFTRKSGAIGAGSVNVRYFLPADLEKLDTDVLSVRSKAVNGKAIREV